MTFRNIDQHKFFRPALGALLAIVCGLLLRDAPVAQGWIDASYDCLFRFGSREASNKVIVIQMDNAAALDTTRENWDRDKHVQMLAKLTEGGCPLVAFDVRFEKERDVPTDQKLAAAMARHGQVVLAANVTEVDSDGAATDQVVPPNRRFLEAATNWGIGKLETEGAPVVRKHWPFPAPVENRLSLPWKAAQLCGARLEEVPQEQWVRYYGDRGGLEILSYQIALDKLPTFFRDKVVFIGNKPEQENPNVPEKDKFETPYTSLTGRAVGGVEILAIEFLNLINHDWLRRLSGWAEFLILGMTGALLSGLLCRLRPLVALAAALGAVAAITIGGVALSYFTNYWFPWLIVVGGQLPCALAWAMIPRKMQPVAQIAAIDKTGRDKTVRLSFPEEGLPDAPEYELVTPHIGRGGYGKVWIARNAIGQWQALKAVYQSNFGDNRGPYEAEFHGLQRYKPVSEKHPGLLRIDLVSKMKKEGYFYYVMELGDAQVSGWETDPARYKPRDLENLRKQADDQRLPAAECLRIVTILADALNFLHGQGLTHRDIKPSNVIFVNGRPKLADVGLVADIRPLDQIKTMVGTPGYMPPPPERPGTTQADIYALGMLFYVITTGRDPGFFPDISTTLMETNGHAEFIRLNAIILKACQPDITQRYQTTAELLGHLEEVSKELIQKERLH